MKPRKWVVFIVALALLSALVGVWVRIRDYVRIWPLPYISQ